LRLLWAGAVVPRLQRLARLLAARGLRGSRQPGAGASPAPTGPPASSGDSGGSLTPAAGVAPAAAPAALKLTAGGALEAVAPGASSSSGGSSSDRAAVVAAAGHAVLAVHAAPDHAAPAVHDATTNGWLSSLLLALLADPSLELGKLRAIIPSLLLGNQLLSKRELLKLLQWIQDQVQTPLMTRQASRRIALPLLPLLSLHCAPALLCAGRSRAAASHAGVHPFRGAACASG
jgi:hypothetical protein